MAMGTLARAFTASLEDDSVLPVDGEVLEGGADSMEEGLLQAQEVEAEVTENEQALADAEEVAEGLESIAASLESYVRDGGLDAKGADMLNQAALAYTRRLGMSRPVTASVESFGGATSRVSATQASLEGIRETANQVWEWIKAQFTKLRKYLKDFFIKVFSAGPKVKARAEALKMKALKPLGNRKESKIEVGGVLRALHLGGKGVNVAQLEAGVKQVGTLAESIFVSFAKEAENYTKEYATFLEGIDLDSDDKFKGSLGKINGVKFPAFAAATEAAENGAKKTKELLGGKAIFASQVKAAPGGKDLGAIKTYISDELHKGSVHLAAFDPKKEHDLNGTLDIETLTPQQVSALCTEIIGIADVVTKYAKDYTNHEKAKDAILKAGADYDRKAQKATDLGTECSGIASNIFKASMSVAGTLDQPSAGFSSYIMNTCKAALAVCEKSLAQYS